MKVPREPCHLSRLQIVSQKYLGFKVAEPNYLFFATMTAINGDAVFTAREHFFCMECEDQGYRSSSFGNSDNGDGKN